ncbi:MAG: histidinol-phosphate aminotransferase family protein [Deltaproteobacteria bacterium]|nr:histidinol-phosphate aminotransferase family protein [Deltaproteobacteria bacterium]
MEARPELHPLLSPAPKVSKRVAKLNPYDPVCSREKIKQRPELTHFKLDWNESTIQPSPKVREALHHFLSNGSMLNWYPDMFYQPLYESLAEYTGSRISQLLVTSGSDSALELICQTYLNPEDNVVFPVPTYAHFLQFAELAGAEMRGVEPQNAFLPDLKEIEAQIDENTKILYLVNPNNPTGNVYPPTELLQLALRHPHVLLVCDEAYFEFSGVSCVKLVDSAPNMLVTRSFSKAFSLASMRIGYLVASEAVAQDLRRIFNPKSVNMMAMVAATAALDDLPYYRKYVRDVKRSAAMMERFCRREGIPCRSTFANWVLLEFDNAPDMARRLADVGLHVRDRSRQLPGIIRLSLGTPEQTAEILARIKRILDEKTAEIPHLPISP